MSKKFSIIDKGKKLSDNLQKKMDDYSDNKMTQIQNQHYLYKPCLDSKLVKDKYERDDYKFLSYKQLAEIAQKKLNIIKWISNFLFLISALLFIIIGIWGWLDVVTVLYSIGILGSKSTLALIMVCSFILSICVKYEFEYLSGIMYGLALLLLFLQIFSFSTLNIIISILFAVFGFIYGINISDIKELHKIEGYPIFMEPKRVDFDKQLDKIAEKRNLK